MFLTFLWFRPKKRKVESDGEEGVSPKRFVHDDIFQTDDVTEAEVPSRVVLDEDDDPAKQNQPSTSILDKLRWETDSVDADAEEDGVAERLVREFLYLFQGR